VTEDSRTFSEAALKCGIANELSRRFGYLRARSLVGRSYSLDEVVRDGYRFRESKRYEWFDW
jgi:hypothetical protein